MTEKKLLDWTGVKGADDLLAKAAAESEEIKTAAVENIVGNPEDRYSNAGLIRELAELMVEDPGYYTRPLTFVKMVEDKTSALEPTTPRELEVRKRAIEVNEEALDFLHEYFGAEEHKATQTVEERDGYTHMTTVTPSKNGFHFSETKIYFPGHDPKLDPVPDNFYAEVSSIGETDKDDIYKSGSYRHTTYKEQFRKYDDLSGGPRI